MVPVDEITNSDELIAALFFKRTLDTTIGRTILRLAAVVSVVGNVMAVILALVSSFLFKAIHLQSNELTTFRHDSTKKLLIKALYSILGPYPPLNPLVHL